MYATIKTGGKQYNVALGEEIDVEKLAVEVGETVTLETLFINADGTIIVDPEALAAGAVTAEVIDHHQGKKTVAGKFKKRKGYKRNFGHRQQLTRIAIASINGVAAEKKAEAPKKVEAPVEEAPVVEAPVVEEAAADLSKMTVAQLKELAKEKEIKIPSGARKADIIELIQNA